MSAGNIIAAACCCDSTVQCFRRLELCCPDTGQPAQTDYFVRCENLFGGAGPVAQPSPAMTTFMWEDRCFWILTFNWTTLPPGASIIEYDELQNVEWFNSCNNEVCCPTPSACPEVPCDECPTSYLVNVPGYETAGYPDFSCFYTAQIPSWSVVVTKEVTGNPQFCRWRGVTDEPIPYVLHPIGFPPHCVGLQDIEASFTGSVTIQCSQPFGPYLESRWIISNVTNISIINCGGPAPGYPQGCLRGCNAFTFVGPAAFAGQCDARGVYERYFPPPLDPSLFAHCTGNPVVS